MWTWDSGAITHDQVCWTYDGYNGCGSRDGGFGQYEEDPALKRRQFLARIKRDDEEVMDIIQSLITKGYLDGP